MAPTDTRLPDIATEAGRLLVRIREERPRVHVLTSPVAARRSADVLNAVGAIPSMTARVRDVVDFVGSARALVVNLGMLDAERESASQLAAAHAARSGLPWVLDPVKVEQSGARAAFARTLLALRPTVLRLNRAELARLAGSAEPEAARAFAARHGTVVAATGPVDLVCDGARTLSIANGTPLLEHLTAAGCALSALTGAFLAVCEDPFTAAASALLVYGVAAEVAAEHASGPGTLEGHLLDRLWSITPQTIRERARIPS